MTLKSFKYVALFLIVLTASVTTAGNSGFSPAFLDGIAKQYGSRAKLRVIAWQRLIDEERGGNEWQLIHAVNDFFNRVKFVSDKKHWGQVDYWATPVEFLATYGGDCEDFSIAKYFTLRELGVPDERLRITYVKAIRLNQAHMVLAYYENPEDEPLILDNLIPRIERASRRTDLVPVYSFNGNNLWMSKERGQQGRIVEGGAKRINLWRDLNNRMRQEKQPNNR